MKKCSRCNKEFEDALIFCPDCGERLVESHSTQGGGNGFFSTLKNHLQVKAEELDENGNMLMRWLPSILSVVGLIVAWNWSGFLGLILAIGGALYGWFSKNQYNKIISLIVAVITATLCIAFGAI